MKAQCFLFIAMCFLVGACNFDSGDEEYDFDCSESPCTGCLKRDPVSCWCLWDSVNYHCPSEIVHGIYHYTGGWNMDSCYCRCERGWTGEHCDVRDTNFYASFHYGTDTFNMIPVRTSWYRIGSYAQRFYEFDGNFAPGTEIDTIYLSQLHFNLSETTTRPFCETDTSCNHLTLRLKNGEELVAHGGALTVIHDYGNFNVLSGNFEADFTDTAGTSYYLRNGRYALPIFK